SKSALSGCLEFTLASGFWVRSPCFFFFLPIACAVGISATHRPITATWVITRFITPQPFTMLAAACPSAARSKLIPPQPVVPAAAVRARSARRCRPQTPRFPPPAAPLLLRRPAQSCREQRRRLLQS